MTDIVLFQLHFSHLPRKVGFITRGQDPVGVHVVLCVMNLRVHVMLLESTHNYSIDRCTIGSPLKMQRKTTSGIILSSPSPASITS